MRVLALLIAGALNVVSLQAGESEDDRLETSRDLATSLQSKLGPRLMATLTSDGPVEAIKVCQLEAGVIATGVSEDSTAHVGRTALKVRNPSNAADEDARKVLNVFQQRLEDGEQLPFEYFTTTEDGGARYMRSIPTQPVCLTCHGSELAPEVKAAVLERYPLDEATGFAIGDLRGAFIVDWPGASAPGD